MCTFSNGVRNIYSGLVSEELIRGRRIVEIRTSLTLVFFKFSYCYFCVERNSVLRISCSVLCIAHSVLRTGPNSALRKSTQNISCN